MTVRVAGPPAPARPTALQQPLLSGGALDLRRQRRRSSAIDPQRRRVLALTKRRSVAQPGRAAVSKTAGRGFESFHSCHCNDSGAGGGIGRHAVLRGQWEQSRKSSNLFLRTIPKIQYRRGSGHIPGLSMFSRVSVPPSSQSQWGGRTLYNLRRPPVRGGGFNAYSSP